MRLRADERGVTVQIGTVLLFAVLIVLMSVYQASVVPQQNEQVEFNHNERVQGQLQDLRDELRRTAVTGGGGSSSVELGTRYPVRAFFVNPPPPSGSLRTTPPGTATIRNAAARGEVGDYWNGDARRFSTRGLVYEPDYHVYRNAPTTVYRNGVLYNEFDGANLTLTDQRLIHGNTISLVALNGSLSEATSGTVTVDFRAVSAATRTVTVRNATADRNVTLILPTRLSSENAAGLWSELLADEERVQRVAPGDRPDTVRIVLEPGTYELRLAKVGVGTGVTEVGPHYVTAVRGDDASVLENSTRKLVVEVRDRYNNPVSGARVNLSLVENDAWDRLLHLGEDGTRLRNLTTGSDGRVTVRYDLGHMQDQNQQVRVRASIASLPADEPTVGFDDGTVENLTFTLTAVRVSGQGQNDGRYPPAIRTFAVNDTSCVESENGCGNTDSTEFDVEWDVEDDDGDFESVTVYVNKSGQTMETYVKPSGTKTYTEDGAYGEDYTIKVVAHDGEGNRACEVIADTANGDDTDQTHSEC